MSKKVFISGSSGFVGQNLITYFMSNGISYEIIGRKELHAPQTLHFETGDIVHLAGKAHDLKQVSDPHEYYHVNFELTKRLYDAFLKSAAKKFIFISSVKAAADAVEGRLTEDVVPKPLTDYGKSKLMAEEYIQAQPLPEGKSFYILRPCMIHGAGNKGNLNLLFQFVKKGIPYPFAAFKNKRSFLSVRNLCFVIHEIIKQDHIASGIYNVADDEALPTNEVVKILAQSIGKKPLLLSLSKPLITAVAKLGTLMHLPLNTERLGKLTENYEVSNQKIINALSVKLPLDTREGILITATLLAQNK